MTQCTLYMLYVFFMYVFFMYENAIETWTFSYFPLPLSPPPLSPPLPPPLSLLPSLPPPPPPPQSLTVTTQSGEEQRREYLTDDAKSDKVDAVTFPCPLLGQLEAWHHVVVTVAKTLRQKSKVSLFMDGLPLGVQKVHVNVYIITCIHFMYFFCFVCLNMHVQ